jgi:hypothetical protein
MLSAIPWSQFFLFVGGLVLIWELYVFRFHILGRHPKHPEGAGDKSPPAKRIWKVKEEKEQETIAPDPASHPNPNHLPYQPKSSREAYHIEDEHSEGEMMEDEEDDSDYLALETLAMEISDLTASMGKATTEQQLLESVQQTVLRFPTMTKPAHQTAINHLVVRCALQDCGLALSPDKVAGIWDSTHSRND